MTYPISIWQRHGARTTLFALTLASQLALADAFVVQAAWQSQNESHELRLDFSIPPEHKIYAESITIADLPVGVSVAPTPGNPAPHPVYDPLLETTSVVYSASVELRYQLTGMANRDTLDFSVAFMGCNATVCFPPITRPFTLLPNARLSTTTPAASRTPETPDASAEFAGFDVAGRTVGYQSAKTFARFLSQAKSGKALTQNPLAALLDRNRMLFALTLLGGGLLLNLTPCVLPMIPINLGIIGAGARASSRRRGFLLGGAYGLGITLAYGVLGVVSVMTGSVFGSLQSSPWFSGSIAAVFVILALALFDVITVNLSKYQRPGVPMNAGSFGTALGLGALSALLAGACVAPVLIWTLLLAADLHQAGNAAGVILPFLLGLGMALPWPFAGAGLSFLPKPGGWMNRVKQGFGVLVLVFAFHYARLAWQSHHLATEGSPATLATTSASIPWRTSVEEALAEARRSGKPVFIDLWATWCGACAKMERTTLRDARVLAALEECIPVKLQCERPREPDTAARMQALGARGLPTYVVLHPSTASSTKALITP